MNPEAHLPAARQFAARVPSLLGRSAAFRRLDAGKQAAILRDLAAIGQSLGEAPPDADPYALALETPEDFRRRLGAGRQQPTGGNGATQPAPAVTDPAPGPRTGATETLAARAGALSDEIDFPAFVAGLIHGTFDAIVDASIRQMEAFADLVSAVAKDVDSFTRDNVTPNQVKDWLVQSYPRDLRLEVTPNEAPRLRRRSQEGDEAEAASPAWLADFGLEGQELSDELIEEQLLPAARRRVGENRLQTLATLVLLGMNRVNVKDGTISAKLRFRAAARDRAEVNYAVSQDPDQQTWGTRGNATYDNARTLVSTVGVNVQADSELKAELFGEVKINFVSETLPLDRFVDSARLALLQRNARVPPPQPAAGAATTPPAPAPLPPPPPAPPPAGGERK